MTHRLEQFFCSLHQDIMEEYGSRPWRIIYGVTSTFYSPDFSVSDVYNDILALYEDGKFTYVCQLAAKNADVFIIGTETAQHDIEVLMNAMSAAIDDEKDYPLSRKSIGQFSKDLRKRMKRHEEYHER